MAISFDNSIDPVIQGSGVSTTQTVSYTTSGDNRILLVGVLKQSNNTVSGVTYNGVSMTQIGTFTTTAGGGENNYLFLLVNPASGANNIVVTFNSSTGVSAVCASSYNGAKQTGQPDANNTGYSASTTSLTTSVTTTSDNCWLAGYARAGDTMTAGTATTLRTASNISMMDSNGAKSPAGSYSLITTQSPASYIGHVVVSISPTAESFIPKVIMF